MNRIEFLNPVGLAGRFTTIRPGEPFTSLSAGETVALVTPDGQTLGYAVARDIWIGDLARLPGSLMELEQSPLHRTYSGLVVGLNGLAEDRIEPGTTVSALVLDFTSTSLIS